MFENRLKLWRPSLQIRGRRWRHWTATYLVRRARLVVYEWRHPGVPWLTPAAVQLLDQLLRPADEVFEWGSGQSTVWLAARVGRVTSVEHDRGWFERVENWIRPFRNVTLVARTDRDEYLGAVDAFSENSLDVVLVDGLYRDECVCRAIPKLRHGGILVVDNVNWFLPSKSISPGSRRLEQGYATPLWERADAVLSKWRRIWTSSGVTDTAIWIRSDFQ